MIPLALVLGAVATLPVCEDVEASVAQLQAASSAGELLVSAAALQKQLGVAVLSEKDADAPLDEQVVIASARLRSACDLHGEAAVTATKGDGQRLKQILDDPEFARARDRNPQAFLQLLNRIREWLLEFLGESPAQSFASGVRLFVLVLAAGVVLVVGWRLSKVRFGRRRPAVEAAAAAPLVLLDPAVHLQHARAKLQTDPRGALREALLALLSELERRRLARPDRVKTNREIAAELPERGAPASLSERVAELLQGYDRIFYSLEQVRPETARSFADQVEALSRTMGEAR